MSFGHLHKIPTELQAHIADLVSDAGQLLTETRAHASLKQTLTWNQDLKYPVHHPVVANRRAHDLLVETHMFYRRTTHVALSQGRRLAVAAPSYRIDALHAASGTAPADA